MKNHIEAATTTAFPASLTFSGSSGGALVATALGTGLRPREIFEMVVKPLGAIKMLGKCWGIPSGNLLHSY